MSLIWCFEHTWHWAESLYKRHCVKKMIMFIASVHRFAVVYKMLDENAPIAGNILYLCLDWMLRSRIFFHRLFIFFCFPWNNSPVWIFLPTFWGGYFSAGQASQAPIQWRPLGLWWKPNKDRNVDEASIFTQGPFFLLCYTPGIFQKAPVWWKLLAAL